MRELRLIFGATTAAVAAVLAIFMAGLGFGSAVLGRWVDRSANPLRLYGLLEATIGITVAVTPWLIALASSAYIAMGGQVVLGLAGATALRLTLAAAVMAVPTFLMGGTLPAAVRAVMPASDAHRRVLGVIYGANTLGAVFGAAAATFFALENLGTRATLWFGCAISLLAGAVAVARSRGLLPLPALVEWKSTSQQIVESTIDRFEAEGETDPLPRPHLLYFTAAVLGFTFFALEMVWYRMLAPILGGTAFTFGLILCVALFGIGVGGLLYSLVFRRLRPSWSALAITCGCEAVLTIVPFALGDRLALLAAWRAAAAANFSQLVFGWTQIMCVVVLPVALVSGMQFPLLISLLGHGRQTVSKHLGTTYAWNTLGAIAGSLIAGFGAMPLLTAPGLWQAVAATLGILSIGILIGAPRTDRRDRRTIVVVAMLAIVTAGLLLAQGPTAAWRHSGIGAGRAIVPPASDPNRVQQWLNEHRHSLVWEADGIESSVGITGPDGLTFVVNGKSDGNALTDSATQMGAAILGAVLHEKPQTALVIGLGTGESAGWLAELRDMRHVDVVELEPAIDEMARRCKELNWDVLNNPRVRRIYDDGREFVFTTDNKYDIILSEPSNPYRAGVAALYTSEFYQAVRRRLNPGGLFIQWLQAYEVDEATVDTVLATAGSNFKYVEVWQSLAADLQLVCSDTPINYSADQLRDRIGSTTVQDGLQKAWKVSDLEGFLGHFVASSAWAREVSQDPQIGRNTDDRTVLEYRFAKTVGQQTPFSVEATRDRLRAAGFHRPALVDDSLDWNLVELRHQEFNLLFGGQLSLALLPRPDDRALVQAFDRYRDNDFAGVLELWPTQYRAPSGHIQQLVLARCYAELARPECLELIMEAEKRYPIDAAAVRAIYQWRAGKTADAAQSLERFYTLLADSPWVLPVVSETATSRTIDVAKADHDAARRLNTSLSRPFASWRFDYLRTLARFMVAEQLSPESVVEALRELEPNVPWTAEVLEARAKAYAAVEHPLAARAKNDWLWFQRHRSAE
jgi:predicted membrane-bound spermidine synthase